MLLACRRRGVVSIQQPKLGAWQSRAVQWPSSTAQDFRQARVGLDACLFTGGEQPKPKDWTLQLLKALSSSWEHETDTAEM